MYAASRCRTEPPQFLRTKNAQPSHMVPTSMSLAVWRRVRLHGGIGALGSFPDVRAYRAKHCVQREWGAPTAEPTCGAHHHGTHWLLPLGARWLVYAVPFPPSASLSLCLRTALSARGRMLTSHLPVYFRSQTARGCRHND